MLKLVKEIAEFYLPAYRLQLESQTSKYLRNYKLSLCRNNDHDWRIICRNNNFITKTIIEFSQTSIINQIALNDSAIWRTAARFH